MEFKKWLDDFIPDVSEKLEKFSVEHFIDSQTIGVAGKEKVYDVIGKLKSALFPGLYESDFIDKSYLKTIIGNELRQAAIVLSGLIEKLFDYKCNPGFTDKCKDCTCRERAEKIVVELMEELPKIRGVIQTDIRAAFDGDPAAVSDEEIILSYPSIEAVTIYRIANFLYKKKVPLIPRIMAEFAHERTGIDINPGASIGECFFIDHGTGVVIGETCTIGKNVKIYQGVTLGAKSFTLDEKGNPIKGTKRHPDIQDNVVIYAGATILGGDTVIGHDSVIGGNVWLTHSIPPHTRVYNAQPSPKMIVSKNGD